MSNIKNRTMFEGDNLDILRGINSESIDLIYFELSDLFSSWFFTSSTAG